MSRYILIRRLRWPAILLLIGVLALLNQAGAIAHFWRLFWPLLLILIGVLKLAERAALASEPMPPYPGTTPYDGYTPQPYPETPAATPAAGTAIVPAHQDLNDRNGGLL